MSRVRVRSPAKQLEPQADYAASLFDPVTGDRSSLGKVKTDTAGAMRIPGAQP